MNEIRKWRENAQLTVERMGTIMKIPKELIRSWEDGTENPPKYVERFVINELKQITDETVRKQACGIMERLKSDEDGNRPEAKWGVITTDGMNEWYYGCDDNIHEAIKLAEQMEGQPAYIICNKDTLNTYEDRDGNIVGKEFRIEI